MRMNATPSESYMRYPAVKNYSVCLASSALECNESKGFAGWLTLEIRIFI